MTEYRDIDDDDDNDDDDPTDTYALRTVLGTTTTVEELEGVSGEAVDEICEDIAGDMVLADDGVDLLDLDAIGSADNIRASTLRAAIQRQEELDRVRAGFGYSAAVRIDEVSIDGPPTPEAWIYDPRWTDCMSETGRMHAAVRAAIDLSTSETLPPMGLGNTHEVPDSIAKIRLPRWARFAPRLRPSNTVSTTHSNCEPNQARLATNQSSTTYNPHSFAANKIRHQATALLFASGSGVVAGARGELASRCACLDFLWLLMRFTASPCETNDQLQNIVSNAMCFPINLELLAQHYPVHTRYEVTRFPGLVFRFGHGPALVFIIFPSGNVICTGFSSLIDANLAWRWLFSYVLVEFKAASAQGSETAAEKKNRAFNNDDVFVGTMREIQMASLKRTARDIMIENGTTNMSEEFIAAAARAGLLK